MRSLITHLKVPDSRDCRIQNIEASEHRKMMKTETPQQTSLDMTEVPQEQFGKEKVSTTCKSCQQQVNKEEQHCNDALIRGDS